MGLARRGAIPPYHEVPPQPWRQETGAAFARPCPTFGREPGGRAVAGRCPLSRSRAAAMATRNRCCACASGLLRHMAPPSRIGANLRLGGWRN